MNLSQENREAIYTPEMAYRDAQRWVMAARRRQTTQGKDNRVRMMKLRAKVAYANYRALREMADPFVDMRSVA